MSLKQDLIEVEDITLKQIPIRDDETDEETTAWKVDHPEMDRPCRGDTPQEALNVFAECISKDESQTAINLSDLAE